MIARLIRSSIEHRTLVVILTLFVIGAGVWSMANVRVDAIPDLSDVQVIIRTEYPGQAPQIVEDQVTYPLTTAMLSVPFARDVRGYSMFGSSFVYIIFEDGTDLYWARSRVLEQLNFVSGSLPDGVTPQLGPDATGVGWVYEYVLVTGRYCPDHPNGLWHDAQEDAWYGSPDDAPNDERIRARLKHHRIFEDELGLATCPLDGAPLADPDVDLAELRGLQDWYLRYELTALDGVSEVAAVGGFVKQYQVVVDPVRLLAYGLPLEKIKAAVRRSNVDVGGRVIEMSETEYMVRGIGYLGSLSDEEIAAARREGGSIERLRTERVLEQLREIALGVNESGTPIHLGDVATVRTGPEIRRGIAEWNGEGETVGGIVVMRSGENARTTIESVRARLATLQNGLPPGVAVRAAYDRSDLIDRAVDTLSHALVEEIIIVSLVCLLFLIHARSALVTIFVLPTGVLMTLTAMHLLGLNANIMSLGGIAIAIGVMVDSAIIMVENAHKHLTREDNESGRTRRQVIADAAVEVGPSLFFALLIITVSFLPIFALGEQSGRLFKPLAFTKTFAMLAAALLAVTIIPVLMTLFVSERIIPRRWPRAGRFISYGAFITIPAIALMFAPLPRFDEWRWLLVIGWVIVGGLFILPQKIIDEHRNPTSRFLQWIYDPAFALVMRFRWFTLLAALLLMASTLYPLSRLGSEFMPPLEEGDLLYMPTTDPGLSPMKARELLQQTDLLIMQFPEVEAVFGKIGRAETATDPAPLTMIETTITLKRDKDEWRQVPIDRFWSNWPGILRAPLRIVFPDRRAITLDELIYGYDVPGGARVPGLNDTIQIPGLTNSWTMPIRTRIDMLATGIRTPVGIKVMGPDLATLAELSERISQVMRSADGISEYTVSAFAEKSVGGRYLDIRINREQIARYGLTVGEVQDVITSAMGGMNVTWTIEGLQRYPVNIRYPNELRDSIPALRQTLVAAPSGAQVPLGQLASLEITTGPPMVKSENARLTSWVYVDLAGIDVGTYVREAQRAVARQVDLPPGYSLVWSGQYEYMQAARARLMVIVPLTGVLIVLLLYLATRSWLRVCIVMLAVPFSLIGALWLTYLMGYNLSLAVWVGVIALAGLDAETGLVMLLYLDNSFERFKTEGRMRDVNDLWHAIHDGAVKRIRPKTMTVCATFAGLLPLLWADGAGADTMRRLAVPMIGGLATSFLLELLIYPVIFMMAKRIALWREFHRDGQV